MGNNERVGGSCGIVFNKGTLNRTTSKKHLAWAKKRYTWKGFPGGTLFQKATHRKPVEEEGFHIDKIKTRAGTLGVFLKV